MITVESCHNSDVSKQNIAQWEEKFSTPEYQFGTSPNGFLVREAGRLTPQAKVLCIADGEGRNSTWLTAGRDASTPATPSR